MRQSTALLILTLASGVLVVAGAFGLAISGLVSMIFDAPDSDKVVNWVIFYTVASFPLACGLSIVLAWVLYATQKYREACLITLLPVVSLILIGIGWTLV